MAIAVGACMDVAAYACQSDVQCVDGPHEGRCEPTGFCSFLDDDCASGRKYAPHAGDDLAGRCVDAVMASSGPDPSEPSPTITGGEDPVGSTGERPGGEETSTGALPDPTDPTDPFVTTGPLDATTDEGAQETGIPVDPAQFVDDFDRADAPSLGNGWIEKHPSAFQLVDGQVVFESSAQGYEDNVWYRDESVLDVEVCIEVQLLEVDANTHPQVHARIQPEDIDQPGSVTSYILYIDDGSLRLRRDIEGSPTQQWSAPLATALQAGPWYQLCLTVTGTDPVALDGQLFIDGSDRWQPHTEVWAQDDDALRIDQPGATGSSGADAMQVPHLVYDNFTRTLL